MTHELYDMQDMEDQAYNDLEPVLDPYDCMDLGCSHFDGDQCTLGGCYDPPQEN